MEKELAELTKEDILNPGFLPSVFNIYTNEQERNDVIQQIRDKAKELRIYTKFNSMLQQHSNELREVNNKYNVILNTNAKGEVDITTENYIKVLTGDNDFNNLFYYDSFIKQVICTRDDAIRWWTDADDSWLRSAIEQRYGIYNQQKYYDAFNTVARYNQVHPIKDIIEQKKWDGKVRIDRFLVDVCGCEDDDYTREVSRMIFYGGINRLYDPGCKFDYMPIFIGPQGCGKSSIIKWLALSEQYYNDISNIEGKDGMEALDGIWICELAELLAMVKTKDVEAMKAYISRTSDKYRKSYGRYTSDNPRQCIFIGTTNDATFLIDKTGNRRYLPIEVSLTSDELYKKEADVKKYILECWREALDLMKKGRTYLSISTEYKSIIEKRQEDVVMDDPTLGLIVDYLDKQPVGSKISGIEIFTKCLNGLRKNYSRSDAKEISRIMSIKKDWIKCDRFYTDGYGQQRGWEKTGKEKVVEIKQIKVDSRWGDLD